MQEKFNPTKYTNQYARDHYSRISTKLPKDLVAKFKDTCLKNNVSMNNCIKNLIEGYIKNSK